MTNLELERLLDDPLTIKRVVIIFIGWKIFDAVKAVVGLVIEKLSK